MKPVPPPSVWKTLLSYFVEIPMEHRSSAINPHLTVALRRGRYQLYTENAVYSFGDLYANFRKAFQRIDLERSPPREVLLLGLGLGSIPWMLERTFGKTCHYTAVELDEEVVDLAGGYTLHRLRSPVEIVCADAAAYVRATRRRFDLICVDVFLDDAIPDQVEALDFLEALRRLLAPKGRLLYNRLAATGADRDASRRFFRETFQKVFPGATSIRTQHNMVLMAGC